MLQCKESGQAIAGSASYRANFTERIRAALYLCKPIDLEVQQADFGLRMRGVHHGSRLPSSVYNKGHSLSSSEYSIGPQYVFGSQAGYTGSKIVVEGGRLGLWRTLQSEGADESVDILARWVG